MLEVVLSVVLLSISFTALIFFMEMFERSFSVARDIYKWDFQKKVIYSTLRWIRDDLWYESLKSLTVDIAWVWSCIQIVNEDNYCLLRDDWTIDLDTCELTQTTLDHEKFWLMRIESYSWLDYFKYDMKKDNLNWIYQNKICWRVVNEWEWNEWIEYSIEHLNKESTSDYNYNIYLSSEEYESWKR